MKKVILVTSVVSAVLWQMDQHALMGIMLLLGGGILYFGQAGNKKWFGVAPVIVVIISALFLPNWQEAPAEATEATGNVTPGTDRMFKVSAGVIPGNLVVEVKRQLFGSSVGNKADRLEEEAEHLESYRVNRETWLAEYGRLQAMPRVRLQPGTNVYGYDVEVNIKTFNQATTTDVKVWLKGNVTPKGEVTVGLLQAKCWAQTKALVWANNNPVEPFILVFIEGGDNVMNVHLVRHSDVVVIDTTSLAVWAPSGNQVVVPGAQVLLSQKTICRTEQWTEDLVLRVPFSVSHPTEYIIEVSSPSGASWEYQLDGKTYFVNKGQVGQYDSNLIKQLKFGLILKAKLLGTSSAEATEVLYVELIAQRA